jgi:predicted nucleic-acid-binding Zn-ribbon protein
METAVVGQTKILRPSFAPASTTAAKGGLFLAPVLSREQAAASSFKRNILMPLNPADLPIFQQYFATKCPNYDCPACGARQWMLGNILALPDTVSQGGKKTVSKDYVPFVARVCDDCGYTAFYSLERIHRALGLPFP